MGFFDSLPLPSNKHHLKRELSQIHEDWVASRFDSLPHVVEILTGRGREVELQSLREKSECIEDVVDQVVQAYHTGFNRAIQNYSQILRLFSESAEDVIALKTNLPKANNRLASRNKQLHQFWYRSVTLRHIISLLDQIERISKIPARIEKFIVEKQLYAAVQLHMQSKLMLEREGLQSVGALQDVRTELNKLRALLFQNIMDELHHHLYNKGEYSSTNDRSGEDGSMSDSKDKNVHFHHAPSWLSAADPDEFLESMIKSDDALHVKYLKTMIECVCKLGLISPAGAMICQNLRPTIHEVLATKIKRHAEVVKSKGHGMSEATHSSLTMQYLEIHQFPKQKQQNEASLSRTSLATSPVTPGLAPSGATQATAKDLLNSIFHTLTKILENLVIVGELLESKACQKMETSKPNPKRKFELEESHVAGGFNVAFSLSILQSECQQLICEILCVTPETTSVEAVVQTTRLATQVPSKHERDGSEDDIAFGFRFIDATISIVNQGWSKKSSSKLQEGYGSMTVLPEQGIYLAAAIYRPIIKFTNKIALLLPQNFSQLGNDGLLAFIENFVKDRFLPTVFVDYRKSVQQAISSPTAFRPRAHASGSYSPYVERGRPVLQGLLAFDILVNELLGWAQGMPRFAIELENLVQALLERTYERCRTSFTEAVLEKQCYMLVGRHDVESLMQLDPASSFLSNLIPTSTENDAFDAYSNEVQTELSDLLWNLCPIKKENLIEDDNKLILLASLSDSLEYVATVIERIAPLFSATIGDGGGDKMEGSNKDLTSFSDEYKRLSIDCLKILRIEMQLETTFYMQEMRSREYMDTEDIEEPDDFIISLITQMTRKDEEIAPFVAFLKRKYIFGGICHIVTHASIKALLEINTLNLIGVQQICRNSIALQQALSSIPSINTKLVQLGLDRVKTYYQLLNMPFEALLSFIGEHENLFSDDEYSSLLHVRVVGRDIPSDAQTRLSEMLFR